MGITNKDKAEAYIQGQDKRRKYRRKLVEFGTLRDGLIPKKGEQIYVQHDVIGDKDTSFVVGVFAGKLRLQQPVSMANPGTAIVLRDVAGEPMTYTCSIDPNDRTLITLTGHLAQPVSDRGTSIISGAGSEQHEIQVGTQAKQSIAFIGAMEDAKPYLVVQKRISGFNRITIIAVNDDQKAYN